MSSNKFIIFYNLTIKDKNGPKTIWWIHPGRPHLGDHKRFNGNWCKRKRRKRKKEQISFVRDGLDVLQHEVFSTFSYKLAWKHLKQFPSGSK